jgi:protein-L-isoaspartate(D-aspartate) O-methyltransferase
LDSAGLLPAGFGSLFRDVDRELFVPDRMWVKLGGTYRPVDRATQPDQWLSYVYSNRSIVTQFDDGGTKWPEVGKRPTSSASMPSVVAAMLAELAIEPGDAVYEVGTGTGFSTALTAVLTGRDGRVTTVEVDHELAASARERLGNLGYLATVRPIVGDGALGDPDGAPFDKVIVTAGVQLSRVPYAWVEQTSPGGIILAPVRADLASGPLVRWVVNDDGTAIGRTAPMSVGFMELRAQRSATTSDEDRVPWNDRAADFATTHIDASRVLSDPASRWALAVALPSCRYDIEDLPDGKPGDLVWLRDPLTGSWASIVPSSRGFVVHQFGPRQLWTEAETAYRWWLAKGKPPVSAWTWTITPDRQTVTVDG